MKDTWKKCPHCHAELPLSNKPDEVIEHLIECVKQEQLEAHPEVNDFDPQDGCENLARGEGPESAEDM